MSPDDTPNLKTCAKCGEAKPATREFWPYRNDSKNGLRSECKGCYNKRMRAWAEAHPDKKTESSRVWREHNRDKARKSSKTWEQNNPEKVCERQRRWVKLNPEKVCAKYKKYYDSHREQQCIKAKKWQLANPERNRINSRARRKANPERQRSYKHRRRARKLMAGGAFTAGQIEQLYKLQKGKCWWRSPDCAIDLSKGYHIDHRIALAQGGTNDISNIVLACPHCNMSKNAKMPYEFIGRLL